jgi:hypothetical protein
LDGDKARFAERNPQPLIESYSPKHPPILLVEHDPRYKMKMKQAFGISINN